MQRSLGLLVLVAAAAALCLDCRSDRPNADANGPTAADSGGGRDAGGVADAARELMDAAPPAEVTFAGEEPAMTCSDSAACLIPTAVCGEICVEAGCQTTTWLRYLDRPRCEKGRCRFDRRYIKCDWRCDLGRCSGAPTL